MSERAKLRAAFVACLALCASSARADEVATEPAPKPRTISPVAAVGVWAAAQLVPSPLLVIGKQHVGGRLRWQLTPLLYSFGRRTANDPDPFRHIHQLGRRAGRVPE